MSRGGKIVEQEPSALGSGQAHPSPRQRAASWAILGAILLLAFGLRWPFRSAPFERDEGAYAYIADRLSHGELPYRDVFDHKPPGVHALYWLSFKLFGRSVPAPRQLASLFVLGSIAGGFVLLRRTHGDRAALLGSALMAASCFGATFLSFTANTEIFMMLPLTGSVLFLCRGEARGRWSDFWAAGALNGIALILKQAAVTNLLFAVAFCLFAARRTGLRRLAVSTGCVMAGSATPVVLCLLLFWAADSAKPLIQDVVAYNLSYYGLPLALRWEMMSARLKEAFVALPPLWVLACAGVVRAAQRRRLGDGVLPGWFAFSFFGVCLAGTVYSHYFIQVLPALTALAAVGIEAFADLTARAWLGGAPPGRALWRAALRGLVAVALAMCVVGWAVARHRSALFAGAGRQITEQSYPNEPFAAAPELADFLARRTESSEELFIFGSEPEIYFYAQRRCPARYIYIYPLTAGNRQALERQEEVVQALRSSVPRYIVVVEHNSSAAFQPRAPTMIIEQLSSLVTEHYYLDGFVEQTPDLTRQVLGREQVEQHWGRLSGRSPLGARIFAFRRRDAGESRTDPFPWRFYANLAPTW